MPARIRSLFKMAAPLAVAVALSSPSAFAADANVDADEAMEKARALESGGNPDDAYVYMSQLLAESEKLTRDASFLMEVSRLSPSAEESVELLERAVEHAHDGELASRARDMLGDYLYARGSYMEAARQYEAAADRAPSSRQGAHMLKRAAAMLAAGDADAAAKAYRSLAKRGGTPDASTPWALLGLGRALLIKGEFAEAALEFEGVARTYGDHEVRPRALAGAGEALAGAGEPARAREALETLVREYPGSYEAVLARDDLRALPPDTTAASTEPNGADGAPGDTGR